MDLLVRLVLEGREWHKRRLKEPIAVFFDSQQLEVLKSFRSGDWNTLVATCVGEEVFYRVHAMVLTQIRVLILGKLI